MNAHAANARALLRRFGVDAPTVVRSGAGTFRAAGVRAGAPHGRARVAARLGSAAEAVPDRLRTGACLAAGVSAAIGVGYAASGNPAAAPAHAAGSFQAAVIFVFVTCGVYAQTSRIQSRMGGLMIAAGLFSALWLLGGSRDELAFSVGAVCAGLVPFALAYLMLAHPTGRLTSEPERRLLIGAGGTMAALWIVVVIGARQPPLTTALMQCSPGCPPNVLSLGSAGSLDAASALPIAAAWIVLVIGTPWLLWHRARSAPAPVRRSIVPVAIVAALQAVLVLAGLGLHAAHVPVTRGISVVYIAAAAVVPLAILVGLCRERLYMGQALAKVVADLAASPDGDPRALLADALGDPTLEVAYRRPGRRGFVDAAGRTVGFPPDRAVTWVTREDTRVAAVIYDAALQDQERFIEALGAAALIRMDRAVLQASLKASMGELAASRGRLVESAHAERRRLERDLHDGVQQQFVGLRLRLAMAAEAVKHDEAEGQRALASVGAGMDDALQALRSLARGIYPSLLRQCGVDEALRSAARTSPLPVSVRNAGIGRYAQDVEVAVYFCCLEAIQNASKHAGANARTEVLLSERDHRLCFEVHDFGVGFDIDRAASGHGLTNMHDRIEAVGGELTVTSVPGRRTSVRGSVLVP